MGAHPHIKMERTATPPAIFGRPPHPNGNFPLPVDGQKTRYETKKFENLCLFFENTSKHDEFMNFLDVFPNIKKKFAKCKILKIEGETFFVRPGPELRKFFSRRETHFVCPGGRYFWNPKEGRGWCEPPNKIPPAPGSGCPHFGCGGHPPFFFFFCPHLLPLRSSMTQTHNVPNCS